MNPKTYPATSTRDFKKYFHCHLRNDESSDLECTQCESRGKRQSRWWQLGSPGDERVSNPLSLRFSGFEPWGVPGNISPTAFQDDLQIEGRVHVVDHTSVDMSCPN